jgi:hypothetical protein
MTTRSFKGNVMRSWQALACFIFEHVFEPSSEPPAAGKAEPPIVWRAVRSAVAEGHDSVRTEGLGTSSLRQQRR